MRIRTGLIWSARLLLIASGIVLGTLVLSPTEHARADGLDFACSSTPSTSTTTGVSAFAGIQIRVSGHLPGGPTVTNSYPAAIGTNFPLDLDGNGAADVVFRYDLRLSAGSTLAAQGGTQILQLLHENMGLPYDTIFGSDILGFGIDATVERVPDSPYTQAVVDSAIAVAFDQSDGTAELTQVHVGLDSTAPGSRLPDRSLISALFKPDQNDGYWSFGQRFTYTSAEISPAARPPLTFTLDVDKIHDDDGAAVVDSQAADVRLGWDHAPTDLALGTHQRCYALAGYDSMARLSWNRPPDPAEGLAIPPTTMRVDVRAGLGAGLGGQDEMAVHGAFAGVPERLDFVVHPKSMELVHTPETTPTVTLEQFQKAYNTDATPYLASGSITDLPERLQVAATLADSGFVSGELWSCPTESGLPPDLDQAFSPCTGPRFTPSHITVVVQNYLAGSPQSNEILTAPADPGADFVLYSSQARRFNPTFNSRWLRLFCRIRFIPCAPSGWTQATPDMFRIGVGLDDFRHALVDTGIGDAYVSGLAAVVQTEHPNPTTQLLLRRDGRRNSNDNYNDGTLVDVRATASQIPADLSLRYCTGETEPLRLEYQAASDRPGPCNPATEPSPLPFSAADSFRLTGTATAILPGLNVDTNDLLAAEHIDAAFDAGAPSPQDATVGLPSQVRLDVTRTPGPYGLVGTNVDYHANARTQVTAGASLSTRSDRVLAPRTRTRLQLQAVVPTSVHADWSELNGALGALEAIVCDRDAGSAEGGPPDPCADADPNRVSFAVARGAPDAGEADLLAPPPPPASQEPPFTPVTGQGLRYYSSPSGTATSWYVSGALVNLNKITYEVAPTNFCLDTRPDGSPFVTNVYSVDANNSVQYADATLSRLPATVRARIQDFDHSRPWIWVSTDSCATVEPPDELSQTDGPTGITLAGTVRVGPVPMLADGGLVGTAPIPAPAGEPGVDVVAGVQGAGVAAHARILVDVPRQLEIWKPTSDCDGATPADVIHNCQDDPLYETNEPTSVDARVATTATNLGTHLTGRLRYRNPSDPTASDYDVNLATAPLPGRAQLHMVLTKNRRLPWTDVDATLNTNTGFSVIDGAVYDLDHPAYVGDRGSRTEVNHVPNYHVRLANVPSTLTVTGRLRDAEKPNAHPTAVSTSTELCPGSYWYEVEPGVTVDADPNDLLAYRSASSTLGNYVDADLDLGGNVRSIEVDKRSSRDQDADLAKFPTSDRPQTDVALITDAPVNGHLRTKQVDNGYWFKQTGASADVHVCVDFDLPLDLELANVTTAHLGNAGVRIAAEVNNGGRITGRVHESFVPAGWTESIDQQGAFYAFEHTNFDPVLWGDWTVQSRNEYRDIGFFDGAPSCDGRYCYASAVNNVFEVGNLDTDPPPGLTRNDLMMDVLFTPSVRNSMQARDDVWYEPSRPGNELFSQLGARFLSPVDFRVPDVVDIGLYFPTSRIAEPSPCGYHEEPGGAVGTDATTYHFAVNNDCRRGTYVAGIWVYSELVSTPYLVARHVDGQIRWALPLKPIAWFHQYFVASPFRWSYTITPAVDGSIVFSAKITGGPDDYSGGGTRSGMVDASGNGSIGTAAVFLLPPQLTATAGTPTSIQVDGNSAQDGYRRIWYFGDGDTLENRFDTSTHTYDAAGQYFVVVVDYDPAGVIRATRRFTVVVT